MYAGRGMYENNSGFMNWSIVKSTQTKVDYGNCVFLSKYGGLGSTGF